MRVAIIDYGSGNLRSATKAFERAAHEAGIAAEIDLTDDAERVRTADRRTAPAAPSRRSWPSPHPFSVPLVDGIASAWRGSASIAARNTRATALKQVSAMWWLLAP